MRTSFALNALLAPLLAVALDCPDGYQDIGLNDNRCYMYSNDSLAWTPAYTTCLSSADISGHLGNLLAVPDRLSFYAHEYYVRSSGEDHWTGLLDVGGELSWADDSAYNPDLDEFIAADAGDEIFGYMSAADGLFHFDDGSVVRRYICYVDLSEAPATSTTPEPPPPCDTEAGWLQYGDTCYLFSTAQQYWPSAGHACHEQGAELISITESNLLTYLLVTADPNTVYWTGLEDQNGTFVWEDGTSTDAVGQVIVPYLDDWSEGSDCVAMLSSAFPEPLQHTNCITEQNYICYKPAVAQSKPAVGNFFVPENLDFWL